MVAAETDAKPKGGGSGFITTGFSVMDMRPVRKLIADDTDTSFDISAFEGAMTKWEVLPTFTGAGYYQTAGGFRIGGAITNTLGIWQRDIATDTTIDMLYTNTYGGVLVGYSFGNDKNHFSIATTMGGGATTVSFFKGQNSSNDGIWYDGDNEDSTTYKSTYQPFYAQDVQLAYVHTIARIFHLGVQMNGVLQHSTQYASHGFARSNYTTFHPSIGIRFVVGSKG